MKLKKGLSVTLIIIFLAPLNLINAQNQLSILKGKVIDNTSGLGLAFANVLLQNKEGKLIKNTVTDVDGKFTIKTITPGTYNVVADYVGYEIIKVEKVVLTASTTTYLEIKLTSSKLQLQESLVEAYNEPLIMKD